MILTVAMMGAVFFAPAVFAKDRRPEVIKQTQPSYPSSMKESGMTGEVTIRFFVDESGDVVDPVIIRSNHSGFEQAAIDAVLKWKFKPGIKDGKAVKTRMQIPLVFHLDGEEGRNAYSYTTPGPSKKDISKMPEGYRYDVAPKPRSVIYPVYPYEQLKNNTKGKASVAVLVDARGKVRKMEISKQSAPEFGLAALAACEYFEFEPATLQGQPTHAIITVSLEFNKGSKFITGEDRDMLRIEKKSPEKIIPAGKLDAMPKMIASRQAPFPLAALRENLTSGEAVVEFYIDSKGMVRLPRIVSNTHPSFGYIAVQTIANWRFEPPVQGGKPVITRARIPIGFTSKVKKTRAK
ncbi:TonB family protein [Ereboglobus luteus]|nr:TonB family protein [Ereboglobus luteus]